MSTLRFQEQLTNSMRYTWALAWKVLLCSFWTTLFSVVGRDTVLANNCSSKKVVWLKSQTQKQTELSLWSPSQFQHWMNLSKYFFWNSKYGHNNIFCGQWGFKKHFSTVKAILYCKTRKDTRTYLYDMLGNLCTFCSMTA